MKFQHSIYLAFLLVLCSLSNLGQAQDSSEVKFPYRIALKADLVSPALLQGFDAGFEVFLSKRVSAEIGYSRLHYGFRQEYRLTPDVSASELLGPTGYLLTDSRGDFYENLLTIGVKLYLGSQPKGPEGFYTGFWLSSGKGTIAGTALRNYGGETLMASNYGPYNYRVSNIVFNRFSYSMGLQKILWKQGTIDAGIRLNAFRTYPEPYYDIVKPALNRPGGNLFSFRVDEEFFSDDPINRWSFGASLYVKIGYLLF